jgi:hypothetical protein
MKIQMLKALAATAVVALGFSASAANAATASADATATILAQVSVAKDTDLAFGTIAIGTSGGTVAISTAGARACGTGLVCSGTVGAAGFTITGVSGQNVGISVPASVSLSDGGTNTMSASLTSSASTLTLDGTDNFSVGGTLTVGAAQAAGAYTGTFAVTVNYQ